MYNMFHLVSSHMHGHNILFMPVTGIDLHVFAGLGAHSQNIQPLSIPYYA